jgi:hypothetical protein
VYPTRWISPKLYAASSRLDIPLQGYETALYEIYPAEEASEPLLAGVTFEVIKKSESKYAVRFYDAERGARLLNPEMVRTVKYDGRSVKPNKLSIPTRHLPELVSHESVQLSSQANQPEIDIKLDLHKPAEEATLAVLLEPVGESTGETESEVAAFLDGEKVELKVEQEKGRWGWYTFIVRPGKHTSRIIIAQREKENGWRGKVSVWLVCSQKPEGMDISFDLAQKLGKKRPMPPRPWPSGEMQRNVKLGELEIRTPSK